MKILLTILILIAMEVFSGNFFLFKSKKRRKRVLEPLELPNLSFNICIFTRINNVADLLPQWIHYHKAIEYYLVSFYFSLMSLQSS